ncbi:hypothetical protein JOM56_014094 [Amanita muscaria]
MDKFSAVSVAKEETIQQRLELKKIKASGVRDVKVEKVKARAQVKVELAKMRQDTMRERAKQEHEFRMAQMQLAAGRHGGPSFANPTSFFGSMNAPYSQSDYPEPIASDAPTGSLHSVTLDSSMGPFSQELNTPNLTFDFYATKPQDGNTQAAQLP